MDREQILSMDAYILLSFVNTRLRDVNNDLDDFCKSLDLPEDEIRDKLKSIGYVYNESKKKFESIEVHLHD